MRTRLGVALVVTALTLGGTLAVGGPAGAAGTHTVTVTPSTGLSDGQTVTVSGTGFVETPIINDWAVGMCSPAILTEAITLQNALHDCDVTTQPFTFTHADANGNLSTPFVVRKTFSTSGGTVTCGQAPNDCAILVSQLTGPEITGAAAPISFGPPVKTVSQCFREFAHDHQHRLRYRLIHLLTCVFTALTHRQSS
ncbi:MAG: neocarzinostatin apoprotein domain-containing protein [Acidimicrobiia bacterium]